MTSPKTLAPAFEPIHDSWRQMILQAIGNWKPFRASLRLMAITEGSSVVVWDTDHTAAGTDNWATSDLMCALMADAGRNERLGLSLTASDQRWLAHLLKTGDLIVIGAHHL